MGLPCYNAGYIQGETRHGDCGDITDFTIGDDDYTTWAMLGSGVFQAARVPACRGFRLAPKSLSTAQIYPLERERKDLYL